MLRQVGLSKIHSFLWTDLLVLVDKKGAIRTLLKALLPSEVEEDSVIDLPPASRLYKTLLQGGHYNRSTKSVERVPSSVWDGTEFGVWFVDLVGRDGTVGMCVGNGNGAFVVVELVEALNRREGEVAGKTVKGWFGNEVVLEIEKGEAKGKQVLLDKLRLL